MTALLLFELSLPSDLVVASGYSCARTADTAVAHPSIAAAGGGVGAAVEEGEDLVFECGRCGDAVAAGGGGDAVPAEEETAGFGEDGQKSSTVPETHHGINVDIGTAGRD